MTRMDAESHLRTLPEGKWIVPIREKDGRITLALAHRTPQTLSVEYLRDYRMLEDVTLGMSG